jgi:hypothetical protein
MQLPYFFVILTSFPTTYVNIEAIYRDTHRKNFYALIKNLQIKNQEFHHISIAFDKV